MLTNYYSKNLIDTSSESLTIQCIREFPITFIITDVQPQGDDVITEFLVDKKVILTGKAPSWTRNWATEVSFDKDGPVCYRLEAQKESTGIIVTNQATNTETLLKSIPSKTIEQKKEFLGPDGKTYEWKGTLQSFELKTDGKMIAKYTGSRMNDFSWNGRKGSLVIRKDRVEMKDLIMSMLFIMLELIRRPNPNIGQGAGMIFN